MNISKNTIVSFHYQVSTIEGEEVDRSQGDQPLTYLHGNAQIIPGLEEALVGKAPGAHVEAQVTPDKGYGAYDPQLDLQVPLDAFPNEARPQLEPGFRFMAEHPTQEGQEVLFTVQGIEGDTVLVSGNHPLAGKILVFKVDVVDVRAATTDELSHGHAHGPGGHDH
jgi:FKBP-type peptidyl-prolyl cis-trans isomerase SlyD